MAYSDPYDPMVAFDDFYGIVTGAARVDPVRAAGEILHRAKRHRAPLRVLGASYDPTYKTFEVEDVVYRVIGGGARSRSLFRRFADWLSGRRVIGDEPTGLPVYDALRADFDAVTPKPKYVRVDTPETYADFRAARREPHLAEVEARLAALEAAVAQHVADNHGGGRVAALEEALQHHIDEAGAACERAADRAVVGGEQVWLPLPDWANGKIDCWRDDREILCTVRLPGERMVTSAEQLNGCVDQVLGCAMEADLHPEEIAAVAPTMACVVGGLSLAQQLVGAAPDVIACCGGEPFVGVLAPAADPTVAATMALLQHCQQGEPRACAELVTLRKTHRALVDDAWDKLQHGQAAKAGRVS